jgi:DNA-binding MarR family transcriptional regulator/GNAT superfamily N-acetyltransferase
LVDHFRMTAEDVCAFRQFNRFYTRLIGTLDEGLLATRFSLPEARVIYELATRPDPNAKEIAGALTMDPGYLSRLLAKLEALDLLKRKVSRQDNRRADLALTSKGRAAFATLNKLSENQAGAILDTLAPSNQTRLIAAMKTIEALLEPPLEESNRNPAPFILRPHRPGDMGWVVFREGAVYAEEYGFDAAFEALVARIVADFLENFDPKRERCWIAEADGQPVGHIFLVKHPTSSRTARLRLFLVEKSARGKGLGHALVDECIRFAREAGYRKITLWTQSDLVAAQHIYKSKGFRLVKEEPHKSFGKKLIGQTWDLALT